MIMHVAATATFAALTMMMGCSAAMGCNAAEMAMGSTNLKGPNAAVGGVNVQDPNRPSSQTWDRHVDSCRYNASSHELSFLADGKAVVTMSLAPSTRKAHLEYDRKTVDFPENTCSVYKTDTISLHDGRANGRVSLVCNQDHAALNLSVRFERCGQ